MIVFLPQVVDEYTTGEIGSVYNDQKWTEVSYTFKNYGPGVRIVSFSSKGELRGLEMTVGARIWPFGYFH